MRILHAFLAGAVLALGFAAAPPVAAQVQLNVCGVPPLPPCGPPPGYYGRRPPPPDAYEDRDFGRLCRTRYERCRVPPRPIGARCTCESDDGEEVIGRIVR